MAGAVTEPYTLVELCAGSAAFSMHLLGARRALVPYQGSKWRFRHALTARAAALGFVGVPDRVVLTDPGPWGHALAVVLVGPARRALAARLSILAEQDPREVYDRLNGALVSADAVGYAAEYLFLQRLSFSGKAVGTRDGRWVSPGFNTSSAYGLPGTDRFGPVKPMVPSMIRVIEGYDQQLASVPVEVRQQPAAPPHGPVRRTLVYLDPPYAGATAYPDGGLPPDQVVALADAWRRAGAAVMVSEQHGVPLERWDRERLHTGRNDTSPFRGQQEEWVTYAGPR